MRLDRGVASFLAVLAMGCSGDGGSDPESAAKLALRVQPSGAQVGVPLRTQPVVEVEDAGGRLIATASTQLVTVTLAGGGTLKGTTSVQTTNGVATFPDLEIDGLVGDRTLVFASSGLAGVTSQALPLAPGSAKSLKFAVSPSTDAQTMLALDRQPVVQAADAEGNATPFAATVTASVAGGNAVIVSGASATTNATGAATFNGLTFGALNGFAGPATVLFAAPGMTSVSASIAVSCAQRVVTLGTAMVGTLAQGDCTFTNGSYHHTYTVTPSAASAYTLSMDGSIKTLLYVRGPNEPNLYWGFSAGTASNAFGFVVLVPSGKTLITPGSAAAVTAGSYSLRVDSRSTDVTCTLVLATSPLVTSQQLGTDDCNSSGFLGDFYYFGLPAGATVNASASSTSFQPQLGIYQDNPRVLAATGTGTSNVTVSYTNSGTSSLVYYFFVGNQVAGTSGPYNLSLSIAYPAGAPAGLPAAIGLPITSPQEALQAALRERVPGGR